MPQTNRFIIGIRRRTGVISLLALLGFATLHGQQRNRPQGPQPLDPGASTVGGKILDVQTRQPIPGAEVTIAVSTSGKGGVTHSAADGSFVFDNIADGAYMLMVRAPDYLAACFVNPDSSARCDPFNVLRDQKRFDADVFLTKGAVARGRVVDQNGEPVHEARVALGSPQQPRNAIARAILFSNSSALSAPDGSFELRGIAPGEWNLELEVTPPAGSMKIPTLFYPGVFKAEDARGIEFVAGSVTDGLVFVVPAIAENALTVRISPGVLPIGDIRASLIQSVPFLTRTIALNDEGIGQVKGLMEGRYFIAARGWIKEKALAAFAVADFVPPSLDVALQLVPAGSIAGRIIAKNGGLPPLSGVVAAATWVHDDAEINPVTPDQVPVAADGSFRIEGLFGARTLQLIYLDPGWRVTSVLVGRSEVASIEVPFDTTVNVTVVVARR